MSSRTLIGLAFLSLLVIQSAYAADVTYQGKVIDADTLEPIEGAVVVAVWNEERATIAGADTRFKDAKETLTDRNGDWGISGPKGETDNMNPYTSLLLGKYYLRDPYFIIYRPGYWGIGTFALPGGFTAYPYIDRDHNLEGIVLIRPGDTWGEVKKFYKKYSIGSVPFITVKDPERKLRDLNFSFVYPENVRKVGWQKGIEPFNVYTVTGLKKAKTREERLKAMSFSVGEKALPILDKMQSEERERLLGPLRRKAK